MKAWYGPKAGEEPVHEPFLLTVARSNRAFTFTQFQDLSPLSSIGFHYPTIFPALSYIPC